MGAPAERARGRRTATREPEGPVAIESDAVGGVRRYLEESRQPFVVLMFLLPGIAFYEVRLAFLHLGDDPIIVNKAQHGVLRFLEAIGLAQSGAIGMALPGVVLVVLLLIWRLVAGGSWRVRPTTLVGMLAESLLMALPLLAVSRLAAAPPLAVAGPWTDLGVSGALAISLGAGLYEELVFRLLLIAVVHTVLVDMLRIGEVMGSVVAVLVSAIAFTLYHPLAGGDGAVDPVRVGFYLTAGVWLGVLMLKRGFGIAVGAHAAYDVVTLLAA
jgi:hypothetical protein